MFGIDYMNKYKKEMKIDLNNKCKSCGHDEFSMILWDGMKDGKPTGGIIEKCLKCGRDKNK